MPIEEVYFDIRAEHNVAVMQLKIKLNIGEDSPYNPICLPLCEHVCRTKNGQTEIDLYESSVTVSRSTWEQHGLKVISNDMCEVLISHLRKTNSQIFTHIGLKYYVHSNQIKRFAYLIS